MYDETDYCHKYGLHPGYPVNVMIQGKLDDIVNHGSPDVPKILAVVQLQSGLDILVPVDRVSGSQVDGSIVKSANDVLLGVWRCFGGSSLPESVWAGGDSTLKDVYLYLRKCGLITKSGKIRGETTTSK